MKDISHFVFTWATILGTCFMSKATAGIIPVTLSNTVATCDDCFSSAVPINIDGPLGIDLFGVTTPQIYINNNGNITFNSGLSTYTPNGLATGVGQPIIAPLFGDVDTRGTGTVTYGNAVIGGVNAFVVDWNAVGYYNAQTDKTDTFQLVLYDESALGAGDFNIQFNYGSVQWETGQASGGTDGLGGTSAVAGYSNGLSGPSNVYYQLPGSLVNGALIDGGPDSLQALGSVTFDVRNGAVTSAVPEPATLPMLAVSGLFLLLFRRRIIR